MKISENKLYLEDISAELIMQEYGSPLYVYEETVLRSCFKDLVSGFPEGLVQIHYSMKANSNQSILKILCEEGSFIDAVSEYEVRLALESGFEPWQIIFTGNNNNHEEIEYCFEQNVLINLGSLSLLELFGKRLVVLVILLTLLALLNGFLKLNFFPRLSFLNHLDLRNILPI